MTIIPFVLLALVALIVWGIVSFQGSRDKELAKERAEQRERYRVSLNLAREWADGDRKSPPPPPPYPWTDKWDEFETPANERHRSFMHAAWDCAMEEWRRIVRRPTSG